MYIEEKKITIGNLVVSYNDEGPLDAPVIIFIHGFPFNKSMWESQLEALKNIYRVIAYDIRGHGFSDEGTGDFSIELFVRDLLSLMDALVIETATLCGLSMGGYIALNAIIYHPTRYGSLVLCDTHCMADTPEAKEMRMAAIENIKKNAVGKYADESIKNFFGAESPAQPTAEMTAVRDMIVSTSRNSLCNALFALSVRAETSAQLRAIAVPVLIMVDNEDKIDPLSAAVWMHGQIKHSDLCVIDRAGHISNLDNPDEFNNHLALFLATTTKRLMAYADNGAVMDEKVN
jgi:pimeloyl-ACP methyl ester carboxylesterase